MIWYLLAVETARHPETTITSLVPLAAYVAFVLILVPFGLWLGCRE